MAILQRLTIAATPSHQSGHKLCYYDCQAMHFVQAFVLRASCCRLKFELRNTQTKTGGSTANLVSACKSPANETTIYDSTSAVDIWEKRSRHD
jgi:hypothetical protein